MEKDYEYLNEDYFSTGAPHEYFWVSDNKECSLVFEEIDGKYIYYYCCDDEEIAVYQTIDAALDSILYKGKTLREALMNTDFTFSEIM